MLGVGRMEVETDGPVVRGVPGQAENAALPQPGCEDVPVQIWLTLPQNCLLVSLCLFFEKHAIRKSEHELVTFVLDATVVDKNEHASSLPTEEELIAKIEQAHGHKISDELRVGKAACQELVGFQSAPVADDTQLPQMEPISESSTSICQAAAEHVTERTLAQDVRMRAASRIRRIAAKWGNGGNRPEEPTEMSGSQSVPNTLLKTSRQNSEGTEATDVLKETDVITTSKMWRMEEILTRQLPSPSRWMKFGSGKEQ